ncbi:MAG TPA: hypothetical protein VJH87_15705, partial [Vicinamibacteria bacterium]|nr:hypothetical protein [Vicinamibacteria bacterium]
MKTVTSTLVLAALALAALFSAASATSAAPKVPSARLLDMYAVREGDQYVVHVVASGDISQFLSDRKSGEGSYHLTLDVPAISPSTAKFDVATPFSRRFQVWPMQLGKKIYSRIEIELDAEASSVVGLENSSHLFVRIHRELPPGMLVAQEPSAGAQREPKASPDPSSQGFGGSALARGAEAEATAAEVGPCGTEEAQPAPAPSAVEAEPLPADDPGSAPPSSPETEVAGSETPTPPASIEAPEGAAPPGEDELFFSLFPAPVRKQQTLFNVAAEEPLYSDEA